MVDLWGFLLQTLTASGVAVLLLLVKALFKDKLPPKWHFAVWGVLGIILSEVLLKMTNCPESLMKDAVLYFKLYFYRIINFHSTLSSLLTYFIFLHTFIILVLNHIIISKTTCKIVGIKAILH